MDKLYKGCIMLGFELQNFKDMQSVIHSDHIHSEGLEDYPHITLMYGISSDESESKILDFCKKIPKMELYTTSIDLFKNDEYDVLKYNIIANDILLALRRRALTFFENEQTYSDYNPHATIAYLEPGTGIRYAMETAPQKIVITNVTYSDNYKKKFVIDL